MRINKILLVLVITSLTTAAFAQRSGSQRDRLRQENRNRQAGGQINRGGANRGNQGTVNRGSTNRGNQGSINRGGSNRGNGTAVRTYPNTRDQLRNQNRQTNRYRSQYYTAPRYTQYSHRRYSHNYVQRRSYLNTVNYYNHVIGYNSNYIRNNWIFYPQSYSNGYYNINSYPYFVYNGYRHRYSNSDSCNYQLVDSYTDRVEMNFNDRICSRGYDSCADERDWKNNYEMSDRFFCAESYNRNGSYSNY